MGGFSPISDSEVYPGLTNCGEAADVPWLSETPITGTLGVGESQVISVTFDASVPEVDQPGQYLAGLKFKQDTPYTLERASNFDDSYPARHVG